MHLLPPAPWLSAPPQRLTALTATVQPAGNPLFTAPNCVITPHIAWATRAARERLMGTAIANVAAFLAGKPENVVN